MRRRLMSHALRCCRVIAVLSPMTDMLRGWMALLGFVPLLCMERVAEAEGRKHFWWWHYGTFVAWNAVTTFWVCNATVGGGIFAVLANALQMSLVFGLFRWVKRRFRRGGRGGALPYLFLAAAWIAWEKYYLTVAEISWPWLVLGNAFAATPSLVQWYEFTGTLGGSLWVWASSLSVFGLMVAFSDGRFAASWNGKARFAALAGTVLALFGPMVCSLVIWNRYQEVSEGTLPVVIAQPDFDPAGDAESASGRFFDRPPARAGDVHFGYPLQRSSFQPDFPAFRFLPPRESGRGNPVRGVLVDAVRADGPPFRECAEDGRRRLVRDA